MNGRKPVLLCVISVLNLTLIAGALLSESALTLALLFIFDALIGTTRILYERLAAGRLPGDEPPAMTPLRFLEPLYDVVLDKRGSFQLLDWLPPVYPRNLPFVIDQWSVFFWLIPLAGLTSIGLEPLEGGIGFTAVPAVILIGMKHYLILRTWTVNGTYANASARTIRRSRELIYLTVVTCFAVWRLAATLPIPAQVTAVTVVVCIPKFLFDCRECGIGPRPLTFDPISNNTDDGLSLPANEPQHVFRNEWRVVRDWAIHYGLSYAVVLAFYLSGLLGMVGAIAYESATIAFLGAGIAVFVSPFVTIPTTVVVFWLGYANEEYRLYDDTIIAYDTFLMEPQWKVPIEEVESVSVGDDPLEFEVLGLINTLPFTKYPVRVKQQGSKDLQFKTLIDPHEFAREVRKMKFRS